MYRIELAPGEEALFKSIDEMAAGIANGVISPKARIWHQTSAKWLPIEFHPHYKIALTKGPQSAPRPDYREAPSVAGPAAISTPPIFDQAPRTLFEPPAPRPIFERPEPVAAAPSPFAPPTARPPAPAPLFEKPAPVEYELSADAQPAPVATLVPAALSDDLGSDYIEIHPPRGRGRTWTVGAAAALAIVVLGGGAAFSAFRSSRTPSPRPAAPPVTAPPASYGAQTVVTPATPSFGSRTSRPPSDSAEVKIDAPSGKIADAPRITEAPRVALGNLALSNSDRPASDRPTSVTPTVLVAHYAAAYDAARADLDRGIGLANLGSLFAASRLGAGQVGSARSTVAGVTNLVRVYRKRSASIEQTYRDSVNLLSRQLGWTPAQIATWENRPTQLESPELAAMANALLDAMDGVLDVIGTNEGGYDVTGGTISFDDAGAARAYATARHRLVGLMGSGADSGTPAGRLLRALGRSLPPEAKAGS